MEAFENLKNTAQRILVRTGMLGSVVGVGAMAIAQLQHDHMSAQQKAAEVADAGQVPVSPLGKGSSKSTDSIPQSVPGTAGLAPWGQLPPADLATSESSAHDVDSATHSDSVHDTQVQPSQYQPEADGTLAPMAQDAATDGSADLPQPLPAAAGNELPTGGNADLEAQPVAHEDFGSAEPAEAGLAAGSAEAGSAFPAPARGSNPFRTGGSTVTTPLEPSAAAGAVEPPPLLEPSTEHPESMSTPQEAPPSSNGFPDPSSAATSPAPADVIDAPYDPLAPRSVSPAEEPAPDLSHEPNSYDSNGHPLGAPAAVGAAVLGAGAAAAAISDDRPPDGLEGSLPAEPTSASDASHSASPPLASDSGGVAFPSYGDQFPTPPLQPSNPVPAAAEPNPGDSSAANLASRSMSTADPSRGRPGPRELEGPQTASVVIHKKVPEEIRFGQTAVMEIHVKNVGPITADNVTVRDQLPEGAQLVQTVPQAQADVPGELVWNLGSMRPGEELVVREEIQPTQEGPIGSVATVSFNTAASGRSRATRPLLKLKHTAPQSVLAGQAVKFTIELSNPGSGTATNVILEEDVPEGLTHSSGSQIEYKVGNIAPQTTRRLELTLKAARAGTVNNILVARADGDLIVEDRANLEVVAPQLKIDVHGPQKRYLERKATFQIAVSNPGTADATNIDLVCRLPQGLQFVGTNNSGVFDPSAKTVQWSLARLPAGKQGKVELTVIPTLVGDHNLEAEIRGDMNLSDRTAQLITVEGIPALFFGVADLTDPIEVGGQTRYEIRVVNQGTKAATNIRLLAEAPEGMRPVSGDGPSRAQVDGQKIVFEPLPQLAPKSEVKYYVTVDGTSAGHHLFRVRMASDDLQNEVTKEESTMVYSDR